MRFRGLLGYVLAPLALASASAPELASASAPELASASAPELAQESPAKRLSAIVGVAIEEYAKGVDAKGRITSAVELEEATGFLRDARDVARRLTSPNAAAVRLLLDSLNAAAARRAMPAELARTYLKFVNALGTEGALDLPTRPVDVTRGRALYEQNCALCHGATGAGDGPAAKTIVPPPATIGHSELMHTVSPALMYRIVSVGVQGTMMAGWASRFSSDERWALIAYVNSLRATDADRASGAAFLKSRCTACDSPAPPAIRSFAWQAERSDSQIVAAIAANDSATGMRGGAAIAAADIERMVAALRAAPIVTPRPGQAPAAAGASDPRATVRQVLRLVDDALTAARDRRAQDAGDLAFDAYIAFEPLESSARMRNPGLVADMERHFADFKGAVKAGDVAAAETERGRIERGMPSILELSAPVSTWWGAFVESLIIIVREGFEAIIVLGAIVAFLIKTGNRARLRDIWWGTGAGLAASVVLAVLMRTVLSAMPASQEVIEGGTMLVAVVVLFSVSYWLISKVEGAKWQRFIRDKVNSALSHGGSLALGFAAFLAVFREGAETALFYQALFSRGTGVLTPVGLGLLVGFGALAVIFTLFYRFGVRIPLRWFFAVTSGLLYYMALVFAGKGIMELQEGDVVSRTVIPGFPHVDFIGLYPTVETLLAQGALLALLVFALWRTLTPSPADEVEGEEGVPPEVAARLAELQAAARRLQDRVDTLEKEIEHDNVRHAPPGNER
jgi:high-affinity iron transporter